MYMPLCSLYAIGAIRGTGGIQWQLAYVRKVIA